MAKVKWEWLNPLITSYTKAATQSFGPNAPKQWCLCAICAKQAMQPCFLLPSERVNRLHHATFWCLGAGSASHTQLYGTWSDPPLGPSASTQQCLCAISAGPSSEANYTDAIVKEGTRYCVQMKRDCILVVDLTQSGILGWAATVRCSLSVHFMLHTIIRRWRAVAASTIHNWQWQHQLMQYNLKQWHQETSTAAPTIKLAESVEHLVWSLLVTVKWGM